MISGDEIHGWHNVITAPGGSFGIAAVTVLRAGVYQGWSSIYLEDLTTTALDVSVFYAEEHKLLSRLFERFALYADAQLAPDLFPRPVFDSMHLDPVPDLLMPRVVAALVDLVTTMFRVDPVRPASL